MSLAISGPVATTLTVRVFHHGTGQAVYAQAKLEEIGKIVSLDFKSQSEPYPINTSLPERKFDVLADFRLISQDGNVDNMPSANQLQLVEKVLVNLTIPAENGDMIETLKWEHLSISIAWMCNKLFTNMNPNKSSIIVHKGNEKRFHRDSDLLGLPEPIILKKNV